MSDNAYISALRISLSRYQAELSEIYLNIDPEIIRSVIAQGHSDQLYARCGDV